MNESLADSFLAPILMAVEILTMDFIFGKLLTRRNHFGARVAASLLVIVEIIVFVLLVYFRVSGETFTYGNVNGTDQSVFKFVFYLFIFLLTIVCMTACYGNSFWVILAFCSGGYAAQHAAKNITSLINISLLGLNGTPLYWVGYLIEIPVCALVFAGVYLLMVRGRTLPDSAKDKSAKYKSIRVKALVSVLVIVICIVVSRFTTDDPYRSTLAFLAETIYAVVSCILILIILSELLSNDEKQKDLEMMSELLRRAKEQYNLSKETIELINIKYHDLKHQLNALRQGAPESHIRQIEEAMTVYGSLAKTGNDALDVILTEKNLYCEQRGIRLTCVVRGELISFIEDVDVYALFGNALSNAIEETSKIEQPERRVITLNMREKGNLVSIHIENYCAEEPQFENGLPVTHKDKQYHGFGMKSMDYIAKKYGGCLLASYSDGKFRLDILFFRK